MDWMNDRRNLWSVIIVLTGLLVGSLVVDFGQLITGSGFSAGAIKSHDILVSGNKTWVGYTEPKVPIKIISDESCLECDPSEALIWLRRIVPTLEAERIAFDSEAGQELITSLSIVTLPAFVFSPAVKETEFYSQAEPLFRAEGLGQSLIFDMNKIGLPIGRYLVAPETSADDITLGLASAPVTLLVFSDFQCQYCKEYHANYKRILTEYSETVRIVWKHLPLPIHEQAIGAAEAATCAAEQDQFLAYADLLFDHQNEWGKTSGEQRLKDYAWRVKGLDARAFAKCLDSSASTEKVARDIQLAEDFNIESAPATFINQEFISGAVPYVELKVLIDAILKK